MAIEFVPKSKDCFCFGVSNNAWFQLVNQSKISEIIGQQCTTDSITINAEHAKWFAEIMRTTDYTFDCLALKKETYDMFLEFFDTCEGFYTY